MKKGFLIFWAVFIGYFIFVHPCIIYYNTKTSPINTENGMWALFYLGLSFLLWAIVMGCLMWLILKNGVVAKRNLRYLEKYGQPLKAVIKESKDVKTYSNGSKAKHMVFEFANFSGEAVLFKKDFIDSRPEENRFAVGKTLRLKADSKLKKNPYLFIEGSESKVNYLLFFYWFLFLAAIVGFYYYSYTTENNGYGWRFLQLFHPLLEIPAFIMFFYALLYGILKLIIRSGSSKQNLRLKFYGKKATAQVTNVQQTGTYINEQPQVKFSLSFIDQNGRSQVVTKKEIVSLMNISSVGATKVRSIIYLPEDPKICAFWEDVNP